MKAYLPGEATDETRDSLGSVALVLAVTVLATTGAGALGAVVVGDVLWKETVKAAISGVVGAGAALVTERMTGRSNAETAEHKSPTQLEIE
jgi:hypothetical protein